ncbi:MAG: extracellular solute-binding protein [Anaerolineae bacterium]|nr:extracellular solute-binding protein [Anaerolineae bacterium]
MKRYTYILLVLVIASLVLAACGGGSSTNTTNNTQTTTDNSSITTDNTATSSSSSSTSTSSGRVTVRWFVGLGTGTDPGQITVQEEVVADFNASQDKIELVLEVVPYDSARDVLSTQIASGNGPDIIGPVGWGGSNAFYGQWLDLSPYIQSTGFDTSVFDPALVKFYQTEEGQVGLPFAVFPASIYFVPAYFDEVGLAYPPQRYGDKYELDGRMVDWNWETFTEVARRLTIDANGYNSTEPEFDRNQIVQVGYSPQWQTHPNYIGSYVAGGTQVYSGSSKGDYAAAYPDSWKAALRWYYDGMWGDQPFIPTGPLSGAPEFGNGNVFNTGKAAMAITPIWYTCCLGDFKNAGHEFQAGILPMDANGQVHGRVDADTFRIWKGTKNPAEAFTVLSYLLTTAADKLLPIYGAMPAIADKMDAFFAVKAGDYPFVTEESWDVFKAGLAYPDIPSAEQYQPNWNEAWARQQTFLDLLNNTPPDSLDFEAEYAKLLADLTVIYNQ